MENLSESSAARLPALVDRAAQALATARTAAEVLEARDAAGLAYDLAKTAARLAQAKGAHDSLIAAAHRVQADALLIESRAKRRLADEYDRAQARGEVQRHGDVPAGNIVPTAADLGLTRKMVYQARQLRDAEARLFAGGEVGEITGHASVFDVRDSHASAVAPGAFAASLEDWKRKGRTPPMLWQHDPAEPIGAWTSLAEDSFGLKVSGQLNLEVARAREAWSLIKQGALTGLSIGVNVAEERYDKTNEIRVLTE